MNKAEKLSFLPVYCYLAPSITTPGFISQVLQSHSWAYTKDAPGAHLQVHCWVPENSPTRSLPRFQSIFCSHCPRERLWKHSHTLLYTSTASILWILNLQPCTQGIYTINPFKSCLHLIHNLFCYEGDFPKVRGVRWDLILYSGWIHRLQVFDIKPQSTYT